MYVNASARTSSGMDENEYRVREVTAQNERLLELLAQSEAEVAELQKRTASASSAASPAAERNHTADANDRPSVQELQQALEVARSEVTALQQRVAELDKDNAALLEAKLMEEVRACNTFPLFHRLVCNVG